MDAGYSETPQLKKLGIRPGTTWAVDGRPDGWCFETQPDAAAEVSLATATPVRDAGGTGTAGTSVDVIIAFARVAAELPPLLTRLEPLVFPAGALWVAWPRKAGGHMSDITDNVVRDAALARSLVDTKVAAIDADWSALRLVWRVSERG